MSAATFETFPSAFRWRDVADTLSQFGVTYRQLDYWARVGYLGSELQTGDGSGNARALSPMALRRAAVMGALVRLGMAPSQAVAGYAETIAQTGYATLSDDDGNPFVRMLIEFNDRGLLPALGED